MLELADMNIMIRNLSLVLILGAMITACSAVNSAQAHRGGQKNSGPFKGCHNDRKVGEFHCHSKSQFAGQKWASEADAQRWLQMNGRRSKSGKTSKRTSTVPEYMQGERKGVKKYRRSEWGPWADTDGDCLNTRHEILKERSRAAVAMARNNCRVTVGQWEDFYYGDVLTDASQIEIDHIVPVAHAHYHGGANWSRARKRKFYNDPENLAITSSKANQAKGANDFTTWSPAKKQYACKFARRWFKIKEKYALQITQRERDYWQIMKCD